MDDSTNPPAPIDSGRGNQSTIEPFAETPEERNPDGSKGPRGPGAHTGLAVQRFMRTLLITSPTELRHATTQLSSSSARKRCVTRRCAKRRRTPRPKKNDNPKKAASFFAMY